MARSVPSLRENAPASSSARTFRNPSALPESVAASAFFLRITPYPLRLWIREFFRGSLVNTFVLENTFVPVTGAGQRVENALDLVLSPGFEGYVDESVAQADT